MEFQSVDSHCFHQIIINFQFHLSGHIADLVGILGELSLVWNTGKYIVFN